MKRSHLSLAIALMFLVWQGTALAIAPCCSITGINGKAGLLSGKETATGVTFDIAVRDGAFLKRLKVGDPLSVNFRTNTATVGGRQFAIRNLVEPTVKLAPGRYSVVYDRASDLFVAKNVQTGQIVRYRANPAWNKAWTKTARLIRGSGGIQGQTEGGAEGTYQSVCDQQATTSGLSHCSADCVLTTTGSLPGPDDDEFSCTCICG